MKRFLIPLVVLLVIVVGAAMMMLQGGQAAAKAKAKQAEGNRHTVARGDLAIRVVETGTIAPSRSVDVRSRAAGRLAQLLVDEGDTVRAGQLIAVLDPLEIELQVEQARAQLSGAQSGVQRQSLEIEQRRVTAAASLAQAEQRLAQLRMELEAQPTLTSSAIKAAQTALETARQDRRRLVESTHPTQVTASDSAVAEARKTLETAEREFARVQELVQKGYSAQRALDSVQLERDLARTRLDKANADRARLDAQQRADLALADESIRRAQADLDRANANRFQDASKRKEYESAVQEVSKARSALKDVQVLQASRAQTQAQVAQLGSVLRDNERQLRETQVRAPMDGVVSLRTVEVGDTIAALSAFSQGTVIVRIEDRAAKRVQLQVNEIDVARLRLGMSASIEVDSYPQDKFTGRITKISPASVAIRTGQQTADAVVKYLVEVTFDRYDARLLTGMSAKCTFEAEKRTNVVRVPTEYLGTDAEGTFVMVAAEPGSKSAARRVAVTVGLRSGAFVEILSGIEAGAILDRPAFTGPQRQGFIQAGPDDE